MNDFILPETKTLESLEKILAELQVNQIELGLRNDELRHSQEELELAQARHQALYDIAPVAYLTIGKDGLIQRANLMAASLLGLSQASLLQSPVRKFIFEEDHDSWYSCRGEIQRAMEPTSLSIRLVRAGGSPLWSFWQIQPDAEGELLIAMTDISEQKRREALADARLRLLGHMASLSLSELLRSTIDEAEALSGSRIGFMVFVEVDRRLSFKSWSSNALQAHYTVKDPHGNFPLESAWSDCINLGRAVIYNDFSSLSDRLSLPQGHQEIVRALVVPVIRENRTVALLAVGNKPSDYDGRDVEMVTAIADLAWDMAISKKNEEALLQSQKMEAVGELAGGLAHDFNNMLSIINGYCTLLQMSPSQDDHQQEYVERILVTSQRAAELTESILAFSRERSLSLRSQDLNLIVAGTEAMAKRIVSENISLRTELYGSPVFARVDGGQIMQIILNLVTNAWDAMPAGGELVISTDRVPMDAAFISLHGFGQAGPYGVISVSDTGAGMDEATSKKIFEPFFTTKGVGRRTGLGLSILYGIVKQHLGFVDVESELEKGSTIRIYLPMVEAEESPPAAEIVDPAASRGGRETILIAEDDVFFGESLRLLLTEKGYGVILARDGMEAVELFGANQERIGLIILDSIMPRMNGVDAFREIQRLEPGVRTLFASGYGYKPEPSQARGQLVDFMPKPIQPALLLKKIREMLDHVSSYLPER
ncbi:MAG: GAF domain-containing protein [Rectinemataceae bacterium]